MSEARIGRSGENNLRNCTLNWSGFQVRKIAANQKKQQGHHGQQHQKELYFWNLLSIEY